MKRKLNFSDRAGFTLVELIVVIAILGILAGVGVVGYSAYVDKANEAADRQLISDVEQALMMGAYAKRYEAGIVGAVTITQNANGTCIDEAGSTEIADMMVKAFGTNWAESVKFQGDTFSSSDSAKLIEAIKNAKDPSTGESIFDSVPGSSFYVGEDSTKDLVADVDEIATALKNVLDGVGKTGFNNFWGDTFHEAVADAGLTDTWQNDQQTAANLTVFAAANGITNDLSKHEGWIAEWSNPGRDTVTIEPGYVSELVMNYAQCVALNNYVKQNDPDYSWAYAPAYAKLEADMQNLVDSSNYVGDFNKAINDFWTAMGSANISAWQATPAGGGKSQAQIDAEAFMASMNAVNTMKDNYVNKEQVNLLKSENAFAKAEADKVLDTMVTYSNMENLPESGYVIVLSIGADGTPRVLPTLQKQD